MKAYRNIWEYLDSLQSEDNLYSKYRDHRRKVSEQQQERRINAIVIAESQKALNKYLAEIIEKAIEK